MAMASLPGYDPNTLDEDWAHLVADEGRPFFNRAVQGLYQPGSALTTLWLAEAIQSGYDLSTPFAEPDAPVELEPDLTFKCLLQPSGEEITLIEAFIAGCPAPFVKYQAAQAGDSYARIVDTFALAEPITLAGFPVPGAGAIAATDRDEAAQSGALRPRDVLGQGDLTMTPLQMASIMSAIAGDGDAPMPYVLSEIRQPDAEIWEEERPEQSARVMLAPDIAARLRAVFQEAWHKLQAESLPPDPRVGANIAVSRSGEETQIWLNGFVRPDERPAVAFVAVLENTDDIEAIVAVGQAVSKALLSL